VCEFVIRIELDGSKEVLLAFCGIALLKWEQRV